MMVRSASVTRLHDLLLQCSNIVHQSFETVFFHTSVKFVMPNSPKQTPFLAVPKFEILSPLLN